MRHIFHNKNVKFHLFIVCLTLFYGLAFTFSEFHDSPFEGFKDFIVLAMQWGVVVTATYGLMMLMALNRYVFAALFTPLTLCCTLLAYFRYTANVTLTPMLIDICMVNDLRTGLTLVSTLLIVLLILALLVGVLFTIIRFRYVDNPSIVPNLIAGVLFILIFNQFVQPFKRPVSERMPYSLYYNVKRYISERSVINAERPDFAGKAICNSDSLTVVLVIGESLRADHLQINGYERATTPNLVLDSMVVSLPNVYTEACYTHTSVPHILTRADSIAPERAYTERSFISILNKCGFRTSWLANQESVNNYVYFMNECDTLIYANSGKSMYVFDKWLDEDLLPLFDAELSREEPLKFVLLHTIGSHWWYESHYTDDYRKFEPVIKSRVVSSCSDEELINSYDNTILYSDYIWSELIDRLKDKQAILIYISDHGESLGEDGMYLHGADHYTLHYPACFVWTSKLYADKYPDKVAALKENSIRHYRTDFLFHSILSGADVDSEYINDGLNIFENEK